MNKKYITIITVTIVIMIILLFENINKTICEKNGGTYIFSFNEYETKCHLGGR